MVGLVTNLPLFLPVRPFSELGCTSDGGSNWAMLTSFDFKKTLINCPPLPGVKSLPLVLMLYILAFADQLEQHQAMTLHLLVAGPTVLLCYQLKVCEIVP